MPPDFGVEDLSSNSNIVVPWGTAFFFFFFYSVVSTAFKSPNPPELGQVRIQV